MHTKIKDGKVYNHGTSVEIEWPCSVCAVLADAWKKKDIPCWQCVLDDVFSNEAVNKIDYLKSLEEGEERQEIIDRFSGQEPLLIVCPKCSKANNIEIREDLHSIICKSCKHEWLARNEGESAIVKNIVMKRYRKANDTMLEIKERKKRWRK